MSWRLRLTQVLGITVAYAAVGFILWIAVGKPSVWPMLEYLRIM